MSIRLTQLVWKTELNLLPSEHHVLLCLANFANDENDLFCYPKISTIAKYCHLSSRQTIRIIKQLAQLKIIKIISHKENKTQLNSVYRNTDSNIYIINELALKGEIPELSDEMTSVSGDILSSSGDMVSLESGDMVSHNNNTSSYNKYNNKKEKNKEKLSTGYPQVIHRVIHKLENELFYGEAIRVINFLNKKTGREYEEDGINLKLVIDRLSEGATEEQCKQVISKKYLEWAHDKKMAKYLRPSTLFNYYNFWDKYKPEIVTNA